MLTQQAASSNMVTKEQAMTSAAILGAIWGNIDPNSPAASIVTIDSQQATQTLMAVIKYISSCKICVFVH
jgi:hypothetical protein